MMKRYTKGLFFTGILIASVFGSVKVVSQTTTQPNILFIAIDDLKPLLGCYGNTIVKTPNIDRLAKRGTVFLQNYCQQAVCGPTRASLMTGMRPDYTKVWDLKTRMRDVNPDIISLPQYFKSQGYSTQGIGKVYDPRCVDSEIDKPSWSVPYYKTNKKYYPKELGEPALTRYQNPATKQLAAQYAKEAAAKGLKGSEANDYVTTKVRPTTECEEVPDHAYNDGANTLQAKDILIQLSKQSGPFFLAVGLAKPHLPFVAPKKYWDLYQRDQLPVAEFQNKPADAVNIAFHNAGEIRAYTDIPAVLSTANDKGFGITLPADKQKELIHGYYASISYTDANVGILLNTLDSLGITDNTIIVLWGDHGWHLGDHNLWCKHSNFEQATRAPLIIAAPGLAKKPTKSPSEFVDIFPTLCDLSGIPVPAHLQGKSLVPLMKNPDASVKTFSVSQYPRSGEIAENERLGYAGTNVMGYSIRTDRYRYTIWMKNGYRSTDPFSAALLVGSELYDYEKDPLEKVNFSGSTSYKKIKATLHQQMISFLASQKK
jgi:arylsulfatase A-like enzyme